MIQQGVGSLLLVQEGQLHGLIPGDEGKQVGGGAEARPGIPQVVGGDQIQVLFLQLLPGVFHQIPRLHGKPAQELPRRPVLPQPGQNVPGAGQGQGGRRVVPVLFQLVLRADRGPVVGHGGGLDDDVLSGSPGGDRLKHVLGGHHIHRVHADGLSQAGGAGHQRDLRPAGGGGPGNGVAHAPGGVVGEIAHRIQRLLGGAGGDQNPQALHVPPVAYGVLHVLQKLLRLRHLALAHRAAGQPAAGRLNQLPAVPPQEGQVVLGHRVLIHAGVHGGGRQLGAVAGQDGGGEHIVRQPVGQLGQHIGRGGGHQHRVRLVGQGDVLHLERIVPVEGVHAHAVAGQGLKGVGADELGGVPGHQHMDIGAPLHQGGGQAGGFIAGDAAGDGQQHGFPLQHEKALLCPGRAPRRLGLSSIIAEIPAAFHNAVAFCGRIAYNGVGCFGQRISVLGCETEDPAPARGGRIKFCAVSRRTGTAAGGNCI